MRSGPNEACGFTWVIFILNTPPDVEIKIH